MPVSYTATSVFRILDTRCGSKSIWPVSGCCGVAVSLSRHPWLGPEGWVALRLFPVLGRSFSRQAGSPWACTSQDTVLGWAGPHGTINEISSLTWTHVGEPSSYVTPAKQRHRGINRCWIGWEPEPDGKLWAPIILSLFFIIKLAGVWHTVGERRTFFRRKCHIDIFSKKHTVTVPAPSYHLIFCLFLFDVFHLNTYFT